jgi:hypothetical protein
MDKIYRLDLLTLIESLQQQSATLTAELPAGTVPGVFEDCKGFVQLRSGEIVKSAVIGKSGPQVSGLNALKYLRTIDRWLVKLEQEQGEAAPQMPMPPTPSVPLYTPLPATSFQPFQTPPPVSGFFTPPPGSLPAQTSFPPSPLGAQSTQMPFPPPPRPAVIVPRQRLPLPENFLDGRNHRERMVFRLVFTMINGHRSIDQIKEQLHLSVETIDRVLEELYRLRIIEW